MKSGTSNRTIRTHSRRCARRCAAEPAVPVRSVEPSAVDRHSGAAGGYKLRDGSPIISNAAALKWLIEQVADEIRLAKKPPANNLAHHPAAAHAGRQPDQGRAAQRSEPLTMPVAVVEQVAPGPIVRQPDRERGTDGAGGE